MGTARTVRGVRVCSPGERDEANISPFARQRPAAFVLDVDVTRDGRLLVHRCGDGWEQEEGGRVHAGGFGGMLLVVPHSRWCGPGLRRVRLTSSGRRSGEGLSRCRSVTRPSSISTWCTSLGLPG